MMSRLPTGPLFRTGKLVAWFAQLGIVASLGLAMPALAEIDIDIPDVQKPIDANIRAFLSLSRYAERKDVTPETMSRLQRRIVSETRKALEPLGYYEPEVEYKVEQEKERWKVTILVKTGRPVRLSEVTISATGPGRDEAAIQDVIDAHELKPGLRLNHGAYEQLKGALVRAAKNDGYLDAHLTKNDLVIDRTERRATVAIEIETGERYHYGEIKIEQAVINDDAMQRMLRMKQGDPYTLDSLLRTQYVLDDSLYFSIVDVDSGDPDRQNRTVPVTITARPNRRNSYAASVGYATDTRERGKLTWDNRRVNAKGHRFKFELTGSSVLKEISARYAIPVMDVALEKVEFTTAAKEEELAATLSQRVEGGVGLTQVQGTWQRVLSVTLSNETTTLPSDTDPNLKTRSTQFLVIPAISYSTLPSYIIGGKPRPYNIYAEVRGSPRSFGSDASFVQFRGQAERLYTLSPLWGLRLRGEVGITWTDNFDELPASQRFFAGGDRSVRGFGLNDLSPKDDLGNRIGGQYLVTGTIEAERRLPRNFGLAMFYDIGNAFDEIKHPDLEYSVGVGVRWHIAVASVGVDVAQGLSESGLTPRLHLYISTLF